MLFWGQSLGDARLAKHLVYGVNRVEDLPRFPSFPGGYFEHVAAALGMQFHLSVVKFSQGYFHGTCVELLGALLSDQALPAAVRQEVTTCGPKGSVKAAARLARERGLRCRVMLEEMMACGTGVCRSCVCPGKGENGAIRNITTCREGPLLESEAVAWEAIG